MDDLNYEQLDPGIRNVVRLLRVAGFNTTDSGDGVTKIAAGLTGDDGVMDMPHVICVVTNADDVVREAVRMRDALVSASVDLTRDAVGIQAMYSPLDGIASVMLFGIGDADLPPRQS